MLFSGVKYHLPSALPHERQSHLTALLTRHGAARADSVFDATHIITNTEVFDGWRDVKEDDVVIVSDLWVERSIAAGKIQQASFYSANRSKIFSGVVACSADLLVSDEEVLSVGIVSLGGQWRMGLTKDVTHLFAVSTTSEKYCTGMSYRDQTNIKVLAPHWFDDTVLLGHPDLSTEIYEWPDPTVLKRRSDSSAQLKDAKKQQRNSMSPQKKALYKTATWDPSQPSELQSKGVWERRRILLSTTLELTGPRRKIVEANIRKSHGEEEFRLLDECDVFVTRYRTGPAFFKAWRKGKEIGTLSWLLNVQVTGVHSSPLDQILHFPIPTGAVKEFDRHEISVTNYTGESRDYLKKLITLMGGNFTPGLSIKNTVLVAAQMSGSKTAKAAEWSISVVNHTWLEDCFLRWQSLTPALPKYISYPTGIDFASILGERGVGPEIKDIIDAEAAKEGEDASQDGEDDDEDDEGGRRTTPHSQNSADETEVEGGLMPAMDVDNENDNDINMDVGGGGDGDNLSEVDFEMEDHRHNSPALSFEDALHSPRPETPTPAPWSPLKRKKRLRGLSTSSESGGELDPEVKKKVVRVEPPSAVKSPPKRKGKGRAPQSEAAASQSQDEDERPRKRAAVGMHTGPPPKKRSRGREVESEAEASQPEEEEEEPKRKVMVAKRTAPLPKRKSMGKAEESEAEASQPDDDEHEKPKKVATRAGPSPKKNGKGKDAKSDAETPPSQDEKAPAARPARKQLVRRVSGPGPRRSPRKAPDSKATTSKLPDLPSLPSFSDSDDFPAELAPPPKAPAPGGVIKVAGVPPSAPPTRQSGAKAKAPPRKATPTPPSSPLSAPPSPNTHRRKVEVVVPTLNSLSASAKKAPTARTASQSVISHHASAPPRSRLATTSARVASPASSSAAALEIGGRVKRTAAAKATQRLHDEIMPDVVNFQNEMRNRGRKGLGARRISGAHEADEEEEEEEEEPSKKKKGKARASTTTDEESVAEKPVKQARKSEVALRNGKPIKLMTTGVDLSDDVLKALANLGAKVTARATECTHLVVATLKRTEKFLCALPGAPFIVTKEWANESAAAESLLPEEDYLLQDDAAERKYGFSLSDAVERARELKGKLFKDLVFYVTPKVTTTPALMRSVVLANGGQIITNQLPSKRMLDMHPNRRVISCADDEYSCSPFADHHPIYTQELVLSSALRQKIDWDDFRL
ncbi:hypothetical protein B0H17DRAFT_1339137 [Mycena rosella]|uniref:BRCT domain-containing protein n=1 Tax=Mycena rosella TaxID=1033263 RepID=A0AAD7CBV0_MYCRO|nr:hypothetical protein B0H17DRAFT_1339137 [Mycena rosella]